MSCFLVLNFQDFGLNQDITKSIQSQTFFCICCLEKNGPLYDLTTCKHARYLDNFSKPEFQLKPYKNVICYQCHNILKKIESFRQQVLASFRILLSETFNPSDPKNVRISNLTVYKTTDILLPPLKEPETNESTIFDKVTDDIEEDPLAIDDLLSNTEHTKLDLIDATIIEVVKNSMDKNDEQEERKSDKRHTVIMKPENSTIKTESSLTEQLEAQFDGCGLESSKEVRVKTVKLTKEQLMNERVKEAQSPAYLKYKFRCEYCIVGFNYEDNIKDHMQRRHGPKIGSVTCEVCLQVLYPPGSLSAHNFRHYTRYDCEVCNKRFHIFDDALHHFRREHEEKQPKYKCRLCNFSTDQQPKFKFHRIKHKKYVCKDCGLVLPSLTSLRKHMTSVHGKTIYKCVLCKKAFENKSKHEAHMRSHGESANKARCDKCDLQFKSWNAYNAHMKFSSVHMRNKFKCDDCGMVFGAANHLRQHARMKHSKKYPYKCSRCPKAFSFAKEMKQHLKEHASKAHGEFEVIICDHCGEAYKSRRHLIRHMEIHVKNEASRHKGK